jgi:IclR family pca regulon transcriptional regulator
MVERAPVRRETEIAERDVVQSLVRGLGVLHVFDAQHPELTLDEVAERASISRSAVRRLLRTLMAAGLTTFDGHCYRLTSRLLDLGYAQQSRLTLAEVAEPHCADLSAELGRTVSLGRLEGHEVVYLLRVGAPRLMDVSLGVGTRLPAHHPAIGRAQLAWLPEPELAAFLESDIYRNQPARTIGSADDLREELLAIRARGWCLVAEEFEVGLSAVAAPVRDRTGRVVAAINLSTHSDGRATQRHLTEAVPELLGTAARIGIDLHASHVT